MRLGALPGGMSPESPTDAAAAAGAAGVTSALQDCGGSSSGSNVGDLCLLNRYSH
jgi:hypothetical protein